MYMGIYARIQYVNKYKKQMNTHITENSSAKLWVIRNTFSFYFSVRFAGKYLALRMVWCLVCACVCM